MRAIDEAILAICTKFSHRLQRVCGLTCYFIAKIGIGMSAIDVMLFIVNYFHRILTIPTPLWGTLIYLFFLVFLVHRTHLLTKAEDHHWSGRTTKYARVLSYTLDRFSRLYWLAWSLWDIGALFIMPPKSLPDFIRACFFDWGLLIFYYFVAVDPLPPGQSKVREFISNLTRRLIPVKVGS